MDMHRNELVNGRKYFFRWFQFCSSINLGVFWSFVRFLDGVQLNEAFDCMNYDNCTQTHRLWSLNSFNPFDCMKFNNWNRTLCKLSEHPCVSFFTHFSSAFGIILVILYVVRTSSWNKLVHFKFRAKTEASSIVYSISLNVHWHTIGQSAQNICMTANLSPFEFYRRLMNTEKREAPSVHRSR